MLMYYVKLQKGFFLISYKKQILTTNLFLFLLRILLWKCHNENFDLNLYIKIPDPLIGLDHTKPQYALKNVLSSKWPRCKIGKWPPWPLSTRLILSFRW